MKALVGSVYLGNINYYSVLYRANEVLIDGCEHYSKQSYRNRCEIYGANGKLNLTVPLIRQGKRVSVKEALIDNDQNWQKLHWKSIESAYRSSPYFEFYEHKFSSIYNEKYESLFQLNNDLQSKVLEVLKVDVNFNETESYKKNYDDFIDYRESIHPKINPEKQYPENSYIQVFENKLGFIPNLSILDLLFNEGPNAINFL